MGLRGGMSDNNAPLVTPYLATCNFVKRSPKRILSCLHKLHPTCRKAMDQREARRPPEYILEVFADPTSIKDVVRGARR